LVALRLGLEPHLNKNDPKWQVSGLVVKYANLRGTIHRGSLSDCDIITQVKNLDNEFQSLADSMPPSWRYQRMNLEQHSNNVLEEYYDVYPDFFTTQTCNVIRVMRILLNDSIRPCYDKIAPEDDRTLLHPTNTLLPSRVIDDLAREICATGPQFTGIENMPLKINKVSPTRRMSCYTLLFPFYVAGMFATPESKVQSWLVNQLRMISSNFGIKNASLVAEILERADGTSPWSIYAMLGSYAFAA
jgi:hypothetical protein